MKKEYDLRKLKKRPGKAKVDSQAATVAINIRLDGSLLAKIKTEASRLGLPYQTLIKSVLYQYATGELVEAKTLRRLKKIQSG